MSLFIHSGGAVREVDPESRGRRPQVDCAGCHSPVERMILLRNGDGGWELAVRCHEQTQKQTIPWRDLLASDLVIGPAFDPVLPLVRRMERP